ncbi:hypothetical protein [uncultured Friedmanniella sp.]|uniref:hypothetical protein n=1 Tax=uncultured Friedmanniella sp. TaxID=335381 RepID=UPI0035C978AF
MDEEIRRRELAEVDAGMAPTEILRRTAKTTRRNRDAALEELAKVASDQEILNLVGLDMAELRRGIDLDGFWSLP